jgi:hypothetical protein
MPMDKQHKHWVTIFDLLEDDIYDGELGEEDAESPRALIEFTRIPESQKSPNRRSHISKGSNVDIDKKIDELEKDIQVEKPKPAPKKTTIPPKIPKEKPSSNPYEGKEATQESVDALTIDSEIYNVDSLKKELAANLDTLIGTLEKEQGTHHEDEDSRSKILS